MGSDIDKSPKDKKGNKLTCWWRHWKMYLLMNWLLLLENQNSGALYGTKANQMAAKSF